MRPNLILAVDPGYDRLGLAVLSRDGDKEKVVMSCCVSSTKNTPLSSRIAELEKQVSALLDQYRPDAIAFEKIFFNQSTSTALGVAEVRGMLETLAGQRGLGVFQYSPQEIKIAVTGYGKAEKRAMAQMVLRLVSLPVKKRFDDEIDAIAVGITCLSSTRRQPTTDNKYN